MFELFMVIIVFSSPVLLLTALKRYFSYKTSKVETQAKLQSAIDASKIVALEKQSKVLNERLAVLEEIVTSRRFELSSQIAQL
ncbi:hypothetical protein [Pseudoalteromonas marina]|uniref:Phage shock protein B n=1 Tax=Pseudoalteromonas marina TaxID=267375 RepID=A0ABT9FCZ1_9GAMM|nr:hypothetical protein [Pseudoalteromonas marina]MDP2564662.1 hypothetical protein [Pseudoalteromonas marina]